MDIKEKVGELVTKISADHSLLEKFKSNPLETIKGMLGGIDLSHEDLSELVKGVAGKLEGGKFAGVLDGIKHLLHKG